MPRSGELRGTVNGRIPSVPRDEVAKSAAHKRSGQHGCPSRPPRGMFGGRQTERGMARDGAAGAPTPPAALHRSCGHGWQLWREAEDVHRPTHWSGGSAPRLIYAQCSGTTGEAPRRHCQRRCQTAVVSRHPQCGCPGGLSGPRLGRFWSSGRQHSNGRENWEWHWRCDRCKAEQTASRTGSSVHQLCARDRVSTAAGVSSTRAQRGLAVGVPGSVSQVAHASNSKQKASLDIHSGAGHPRWSAAARGGLVQWSDLLRLFCEE